MKVGDLTVGALLQPKPGFVWLCHPVGSAYSSYKTTAVLECVRRYSYHDDDSVSTTPLLYLGKAPKRDAHPAGDVYEPRHVVLHSGIHVRVAPESWRNVIEVKSL